ncbi:MAG: rhodanese-like domain-containing protein [Thermodesulfovibrionales bacterium]|nr:rhodanese-like domain-containing protein [Thermodesulfovibrionales bacterium]
MKQLVIFLIVFLFLLGNAYAYDKETAKKFDAMFSQMTPEMIAKRPCEIDSKALFDLIKKKEEFVILDIRTPQEVEIVGITLKNTLRIPMNEVFKEENLKRLPKDKKIIVICHTGTRSVAVTTALWATGFTNALTFKGGIIELSGAAGRSVVGLLW